MMNSISATAEDDVLRKLYKFRELVLDRLFLSEAEVERVFSAHMNIHTKIRSSLSPDIVEKVLYVRYIYSKQSRASLAIFPQ